MDDDAQIGRTAAQTARRVREGIPAAPKPHLVRVPYIAREKHLRATAHAQDAAARVHVHGHRRATRQRERPGSGERGGDIARGGVDAETVEHQLRARDGDRHENRRQNDDDEKLENRVAAHPGKLRRTRNVGSSIPCASKHMVAAMGVHPHVVPKPQPNPMARLSSLAAIVFLCSCRDPRAEANIAQAMIDVGTQLTAMQQDYSILQSQVDSLRQVIARQDTSITRLASMVGLPLQPR